MKSISYCDKKNLNNLPDLSRLSIDLKKPYLILAQHPVTTSYKTAAAEMSTVLEALQEVSIQSVLIYPNPDAGSHTMVKEIRKHQRKYGKDSVIKNCYKNIGFDSYLNLLKHSSCLVGNSSSGIREAHFYGTPVVNIGPRQKDRERTKNIADVPCIKASIIDSVREQLNHGYYTNIKSPYGTGDSAIKIAKKLVNTRLDNIIQKRLERIN